MRRLIIFTLLATFILIIIYNFFEHIKPIFLNKFGRAIIVKRNDFTPNTKIKVSTFRMRRKYLPFYFNFYIFEFNPKQFKIGIEDNRNLKSKKDLHQSQQKELRLARKFLYLLVEN